MSKLRSILAYQGSKYKLLPELIDFIPEGHTLYDVFGGSATVSINLQSKFKRTVYNEYDPNIFDIVKYFKDTDINTLIRQYRFYINKWKLGKHSEEEYYLFRSNYNRYPLPMKLWVLSKHSFSSLIRFSSEGFNLPFGKRGGISKTVEKNIANFHKAIQNVKLKQRDYRDFVSHYVHRSKSNDIFYFDPPYLASGDNVYKGDWAEEDEKQLLTLLTELDILGIKFVLSNVTRHRNKVNKPLKKFIKRNKHFTVIAPQFSTKGEGYTLNRAVDTAQNETVEILLKNF